MIDVSELIEDPDFAQSFTVTRRTGHWVDGNFVTTPKTIKMTGVIQPMNTRDVQMLPQGDTVKGAVNIWTTQPLHVTRLDKNEESGAVSDEVTWQGEAYKILEIQNFSDGGYYQAAAVRKLGA